MTRRPLVALITVLAVLGLFAAGLAWFLETPRPSAGATHGERLYLAYCVHCHGESGHGSWPAALLLIRPGDLTDRARMSRRTDSYLFDIIKHGGSPIGRPGMPGFEHLPDADVEALVQYVRTLAAKSSSSASE